MKPRSASFVLPLALVAAGGCKKSELPAAASGAADAASAGAKSAPWVVEAAAPPTSLLGVLLSGETVELAPRAEGRLVAVLVEPGSRVRRGQPVARMDLRDLAKQLALARATLGHAHRRVVRRAVLASGALGAISKEELAAARVTALEKKAKVEELVQTLADAEIRAPFDGVVAARYVDPGAVVGPGKPVVRLVGQTAPRVRFAIPEDRAGDVRLQAPVKVEVRTHGLSLPGVVAHVAPEVDAGARVIFAVADVEVPPEWIGRIPSGTAVRVAVEPGLVEQRLRTRTPTPGRCRRNAACRSSARDR